MFLALKHWSFPKTILIVLPIRISSVIPGMKPWDQISFAFLLDPDAVYPVYGILHYRDGLRYLVQNENGLPVFIPRQLFKIEEPRIPLDWQIAEYKFQEQSLLIISYDTITESYPALCDLIELRPEAVRAFLDYKDSMMG